VAVLSSSQFSRWRHLRVNLAKKSLCPLLFCCPVLLALAASATAQELSSYVNGETTNLVEIYKGFHERPELSHFEAHTSALLAEELRKAGYTVTEHVGKYPDGSQAYGVVAMLKNGAGPTLLVRADMDALPIVEETGVPYASQVTTKNADGQQVGVMHACGHDIHTTVLIGTARALAAHKNEWHGTLMLIGQPSEETVDGAKAMLADHLYERFGRPDMIIGLHDAPVPAGTVLIAPGARMASATSIDVTIRGIGGHGAKPELGRDPVTLAAYYITQIQTIVSREEDPLDPAVVTVGTIHGGTKRNIIPDEVKLQLTARAFSDHGRQVIIDGLKQMAAGLTASAGLPPEKAATVTVLENESTPVQYNNPALTARVHAAVVKALGEKAVIAPAQPIMVSEDVGIFGLPGNQIPVCYFNIGAIDPKVYAADMAAHTAVPGVHTSKFQPDPELTLQTGVMAMTSAAVALLQ
jgi:amidohydrolase